MKDSHKKDLKRAKHLAESAVMGIDLALYGQCENDAENGLDDALDDLNRARDLICAVYDDMMEG